MRKIWEKYRPVLGNIVEVTTMEGHVIVGYYGGIVPVKNAPANIYEDYYLIYAVKHFIGARKNQYGKWEKVGHQFRKLTPVLKDNVVKGKILKRTR